MLATTSSSALHGIDAYCVAVEVDVSPGLPGYHVVGLPAISVREGAVRIRAALDQCGCPFPNQRVTINLAPADRRKEGAAFDLPIAAAVLIANELAPPDSLDGLLLLGELGLDGALRPVKGALAAGLLARDLGLRGVVLPESVAEQAAFVDGIEVYRVDHLAELIAVLLGKAAFRRVPHRCLSTVNLHRPSEIDLADVRGQDSARTALEVSVAGGHNLLLSGPPGIGKTMLARRIPTLLPPLSLDEALETTKVYSALGLCADELVVKRPFRAPHSTISSAALLGGGSPPRPGEVSLAHNGVLFLDELPEFQRGALEALRQPLEDRTITLGRVHGTVCLPASFLLAASANPCPCGYRGSELKGCVCAPTTVERYRNRLSGPLLDRIDMQVFVRHVALEDLRRATPGEPSAFVRARVHEARDRQRSRLAPFGVRTNAEMGARVTRQTCPLTASAESVLSRLHTARNGMSARAVDRLIRVARTIADLRGEDAIGRECLLEAASYRALDEDAHARPVPHRSPLTAAVTGADGSAVVAAPAHDSGPTQRPGSAVAPAPAHATQEPGSAAANGSPGPS